MNPAGWVLIGLATWVGCQVLGGDALGRLRLTPGSAAAGHRDLAAPDGQKWLIRPKTMPVGP